MAFERREWLTPARHAAKAVATGISIFTLSTPAGFTCCIYSAKVTNPTYHRIKRALLAN